MTSTSKHPEQRRYCDQDYHGGVTDAERDRWCFDYHSVRLPQVDLNYRSKMRKAQTRWDAFYASPSNGYC